MSPGRPSDAPPMRPGFEIGLVLAGAVSAGCYSAGVMDFIIEALDDYYCERDKDGWNGPRHDVRVPVLAGASAGGMTAAMAALHMFRGLEHVWPDEPVPPKPQNRLYSSWVTDISIERLLETTDLDGNTDGLRSALCSDVLDQILADAFVIDGPLERRPWIGRGDDRTLRVLLTITNLRGVPYSFDIFGNGSIDHFGMINHADVAAFRLGSAAPANGTWLDVGDTQSGAWDPFKVAALATGAFPVGLAPRFIHGLADVYQTSGTVGFDDPKTGLYLIIKPDGRFPVTGPFDYWAVDGGTINNEPLEQARRHLTDGADETHDGDSADRAVIMIAPFPTFTDLKADTADGTLLTVLSRLVASILDQARFKPEELAQAQDPSNFSRFLISPIRTKADGSDPDYPIASGALFHFGGFLDESFRRHDYLLGRRNAQAFLRWNFALPAGHRLFAAEGIDPTWIVKDPGPRTETLEPGADDALPPKLFSTKEGQAPTDFGYPIIPLTSRMREPIALRANDQPKVSPAILDALRPAIRARVAAAVDRLIDVDLRPETDALGWAIGGLAREGGKKFGTEVLTQKATEAIQKALADLANSFP